jgi:hypothetical protein
MRTKKQIETSRKNGRKSRGAITPEGKARIVAANLKSGVFAEAQIVPWEDRDALQAIKDEYYARHPPVSPEARCLVDQVITCEWHLRRFTWVEDSLWHKLSYQVSLSEFPSAHALETGDRTFTRLQHRINSTRRAFQNALARLEELESRDHDVVIVTPSPETHLPALGSLRKIDDSAA